MRMWRLCLPAAGTAMTVALSALVSQQTRGLPETFSRLLIDVGGAIPGQVLLGYLRKQAEPNMRAQKQAPLWFLLPFLLVPALPSLTEGL